MKTENLSTKLAYDFLNTTKYLLKDAVDPQKFLIKVSSRQDGTVWGECLTNMHKIQFFLGHTSKPFKPFVTLLQTLLNVYKYSDEIEYDVTNGDVKLILKNVLGEIVFQPPSYYIQLTPPLLEFKPIGNPFNFPVNDTIVNLFKASSHYPSKSKISWDGYISFWIQNDPYIYAGHITGSTLLAKLKLNPNVEANIVLPQYFDKFVSLLHKHSIDFFPLQIGQNGFSINLNQLYSLQFTAEIYAPLSYINNAVMLVGVDSDRVDIFPQNARQFVRIIKSFGIKKDTLITITKNAVTVEKHEVYQTETVPFKAEFQIDGIDMEFSHIFMPFELVTYFTDTFRLGYNKAYSFGTLYFEDENLHLTMLMPNLGG